MLTRHMIAHVALCNRAASTADDIAEFFNGLEEVQMVYTLAGDADSLIHVRVRSLDELATFVHRRLLSLPKVS